MRQILSGAILVSLLLPTGTAFAADGSQKIEERPHRYQEAISYVRSTGIMLEFSDGAFHPERSVSRSELLMTVVHDIYPDENFGACFDAIAPNPPARFSLLFTDVPVTASYAEEICVGMLVGIVSGSPDGRFRPFENTNLVEAAKVIGKAYGTASLPSFRPQPKVPWYESYRYGLARKDAIPATVRNLGQQINRGELAYILWKLRNDRPMQGFRYKATVPKVRQEPPMKSEQVDSDDNVIRLSPNRSQNYRKLPNEGIVIADQLIASRRPRYAEKPVNRELRKKVRKREGISTEP